VSGPTDTGAIVYANPSMVIFRQFYFLMLGAAAIGAGVSIGAGTATSETARRANLRRALAWMLAFVAATLLIWYWEPLMRAAFGTPPVNAATSVTGSRHGGSNPQVHWPEFGKLSSFALFFGLLGGSLSTLVSIPMSWRSVVASVITGFAWAGGLLLAAVILPITSYVLLVIAHPLPVLLLPVIALAGGIAGALAAAVAVPVQERTVQDA